MIRRPPRSTLSSSSAASDVYKRQGDDSGRRRVRRDRVPGCPAHRRHRLGRPPGGVRRHRRSLPGARLRRRRGLTADLGRGRGVLADRPGRRPAGALGGWPGECAVTRAVHPIEARSHAILRARVDLTHLPPLTRAVVERVVHASADLDYVEDLVCAESTLRAGVAALAAGAPVVADAEMVAAGITARDVVCRVRDTVADPGRTRSATAIRRALAEVGPGAVSYT